jgi:hypothetical protein
MPLSLPEDQNNLYIGKDGGVIGIWKVVLVKRVLEKKYIWKDIYPFIAAKLRLYLKLK